METLVKGVDSVGEGIQKVSKDAVEFQSASLGRHVRIDFYNMPFPKDHGEMSLLLVNDGQYLAEMEFDGMLANLHRESRFRPLMIAAIHAGPGRRHEYGMSSAVDCQGLGSRALDYERFIITELLPFIRLRYAGYTFVDTGFAGFSAGGLSALDIAWNHADIFSRVGVFSGALWWRSVDKLNKEYDPWEHRLMHRHIRDTAFRPGMKLFFQCGEKDEWEDRNNNKIIDSIDDTLDLIRVLVRKGYREGQDIRYLQMPNGKHEVRTWAVAFPDFLRWGWTSAKG